MNSDELRYNILYSCSAGKSRGGEAIVPEHALAYIISGSISFFYNGEWTVFGPGTVALLRKNLLVKSVKQPGLDGTAFQSLSVYLDQSSLRAYSGQTDTVAQGAYSGEAVLDLSRNAFLKGYFESLLPYFSTDEAFTETMAGLKTREAIELVLRHQPRLRNMLFDFSEPFKTDLAAFMAQHYLFNLPIARFARLSGRSLATFKRDFRKAFDDTPGRWLLKQRLQRAHFLLGEQHQSPVEIYLDLGFESLSHFSDAFKKHFGYNPSTLR